MQKIANSSNIKSKRKSTQKLTFNVQVFLDTAGVARKVIEFKKAEVVYSQGDAARSIMYLQSGRIKLSVVNEVGKEAVVAILEPGDFFGEGCLAGQPVRMGTATAITPSAVLDIEKSEMFKVVWSKNSSCPLPHARTSLQSQVHDKSRSVDPLLGLDCTHPYIYVR
jgi:CRP-like cAMP-binding protein